MCDNIAPSKNIVAFEETRKNHKQLKYNECKWIMFARGKILRSKLMRNSMKNALYNVMYILCTNIGDFSISFVKVVQRNICIIFIMILSYVSCILTFNCRNLIYGKFTARSDINIKKRVGYIFD